MWPCALHSQVHKLPLCSCSAQRRLRIQKRLKFYMDPLLLAVFCRERGSSRVCLKGRTCILTHQSSQPWVWGRRNNLSLLWRGCQYLNMVIAVGLYSIWQEEMGRVMKMWALHLHTECSTHLCLTGCCSSNIVIWKLLLRASLITDISL